MGTHIETGILWNDVLSLDNIDALSRIVSIGVLRSWKVVIIFERFGKIEGTIKISKEITAEMIIIDSEVFFKQLREALCRVIKMRPRTRAIVKELELKEDEIRIW